MKEGGVLFFSLEGKVGKEKPKDGSKANVQHQRRKENRGGGRILRKKGFKRLKPSG